MDLKVKYGLHKGNTFRYRIAEEAVLKADNDNPLTK
jgi:hypothetical protein